MQSLELAKATTEAISHVTAAFMIDPATYQRGAELGYPGADFYFAGRGAVLGDVPGDVVAAAFVFFATDQVADAYNRSAGVQTRPASAAAFAEAGHDWARAHLSGDALATIATLAGRVVAAADPAGAPLFAGWRHLEVPDDAPGAAHHQLNALRELRGAYHGGAVLGVGLSPHEAVTLADPHMVGIHGWAEPASVTEAQRGLLAQAEDLTNAAMARAFRVLDGAEADAFAAACAELHAQL